MSLMPEDLHQRLSGNYFSKASIPNNHFTSREFLILFMGTDDNNVALFAVIL